MADLKILNEMRRAYAEVLPSTLFESRLDTNPLFIREGLICSYPIERVICSIAQLFKLHIGGGTLSAEHSGRIGAAAENADTDVIRVALKKSAIGQKNSMDSHFLKYGWYNFRTDDSDDGNKNRGLFRAPKIQTESFNFLKNSRICLRKLYHF